MLAQNVDQPLLPCIIRPYIDKETTERLVHAFVMCYIDYCNSLLYGLPDTQLQKLQVIQNSAARLSTRTKKKSHIKRALHWYTHLDRGPRRFIQPKRGQANDPIGSWHGPWRSQKCIAAGSHR